MVQSCYFFCFDTYLQLGVFLKWGSLWINHAHESKSIIKPEQQRASPSVLAPDWLSHEEEITCGILFFFLCMCVRVCLCVSVWRKRKCLLGLIKFWHESHIVHMLTASCRSPFSSLATVVDEAAAFLHTHTLVGLVFISSLSVWYAHFSAPSRWCFDSAYNNRVNFLPFFLLCA